MLEPLTRTGKTQKFDDWRKGVSNIARLKEGEDYIRQEVIAYETFDKTNDLSISEISETDTKPKKRRGTIPRQTIDFILTLRAGEYCATLTKGDAGDLYRRFIFDIKDEFIRLVFRRGKSIDTRKEFTTAISNLNFVQSLSSKEQGRVFAKYTNKVYLQLQDVEMTAKEYRKKHGISKRAIAKHYFKKDGLLDLEKVENNLATIINYIVPKSERELDEVFEKFFDSLSE